MVIMTQLKESMTALFTGIRSHIDTKLGKTENAVSASRLLTPRKIALTGDATWGVTFGGNADVTNVLTLTDTGVNAGSYGSDLETPVLTVDSKGRIVSAASTGIRLASLTKTGVVQLSSAVNSTSETQASTPKAVKFAYDLAAAAVPASEKGVASGVATLDSNGKLTAAQMPTTAAKATDAEKLGGNLPAFYQDASNLLAGTLPTARLGDSGAVPGDYTKVTIDAKGRVVLGRNLAAADIPTLDVSKIGSGVFPAARIPTLNQSTTGNAATASKVVATASDDGTAELLLGTMGANDRFRILIGGARDLGYAEIATADNGDEPIYVRQYSGVFTDLRREAVLLDANGNTSFPGNLRVEGGMTFDTIRHVNSYTQRFSQSYVPTSYMVDGEYQEVLTITPSSSSQNYVIKGRVVTQIASNIQIIDFTVTLRSNTLPDLAWEASYSEELFGGISFVTPVIWAKETDAAVWKLALKHNSGTIHNITVDVEVINRGNYDDTRMNTVVTSETTVVPTGYVEHSISRMATVVNRAISFVNNVTAPSFTGNLAGNSNTATKWLTPRSIDMTGDATWTVSMDGSANASAALTLSDSGVVAGTYGKVTVDAKGRVTAGASLLASDIPTLDSTKVISAQSAAKLTSVRTLSLTGDGSWSVPFDGSGNATAAFTLTDTGVTAGTYGSGIAIPQLTVDSKGRVTGVASVPVNVTLPAASLTTAGISRLSSSTTSTDETQAATPAAVKSAMDTAKAALPKTGGLVSGHLAAYGFVDRGVNVTGTGNTTLNINLFSVFDISLTGNTTLVLSAAPDTSSWNQDGGTDTVSILVRVRQPSTVYTLTWWSNITWLTEDGSIGTPPAAGKIREFILSTTDFVNWLGRIGPRNG